MGAPGICRLRSAQSPGPLLTCSHFRALSLFTMLKSNWHSPIISSCFTFSCTVATTNEPAYHHSPHSTGQGQYSSNQNGRGHVSKSLLSVNSNDRNEMGWCRRAARHLPGFLQMASTRNPSDAPRAHVAVGSGRIRVSSSTRAALGFGALLCSCGIRRPYPCHRTTGPGRHSAGHELGKLLVLNKS